MRGIGDLVGIRAFLDERLEAMAAAVLHFLDESGDLLAAPDSDEAARERARTILLALGDAGLLRYGVPESGGLQLRAAALAREGIAYGSPLADAVFALQALGGMPIALAGTPEQCDRWLPEIARGTVMAAFAMTEPEAGSDVAAIQTRALRDGDDYRLEGQKWLISNAGIADVYIVYAATEPNGGRHALSAFIVEADNPGLHFVRPQILSSPHPLGEIALEGCRVHASARLGAEGDGLKLGLDSLARLRPTVAAAACGMAARALDEALTHAKLRRQFGKPLVEQQLVQAMLATMATELEAARLLTYRAAWEHDTGSERLAWSGSMAKWFATEAAQRVVDQAVQILGGRGCLAEHPVDHLYRAVRALRIYEGTSEIQQLVIARELRR